jgi:anti-sigma factor ChrR (cupin superfamily)
MTTVAEEAEILVQTDDLDWQIMGEGVGIKILRVSEETGQWTGLIRMEAGATFAAHKHLGAADGYVLKGCLEYRVGVAETGSYLYEPLGAVHEATTCSEETVILFSAYGPIVFHAEDGSVTQILSYETALALREGAKEHFTADRAKPAA